MHWCNHCCGFCLRQKQEFSRKWWPNLVWGDPRAWSMIGWNIFRARIFEQTYEYSTGREMGDKMGFRCFIRGFVAHLKKGIWQLRRLRIIEEGECKIDKEKWGCKWRKWRRKVDTTVGRSLFGVAGGWCDDHDMRQQLIGDQQRDQWAWPVTFTADQ